MDYYYIATDGNDGDLGTIAEPFATLEAARDAIRALGSLPVGGVTVFLRGGTYRRTATFALTNADHGTSANPIAYRSYPGETAVIDGGVLVTGDWTAVGDGSYSTPMAAEFNSLFVGGCRAQRSRLPESGYYTIASVPDETKRTAFKFSGTDILDSWTNLTDIEIVSFRHWYQTRFRIASVVDDLVTIDGECRVNRDFAWDYDPITSSRYFVENVKEGLVAGSWYLDTVADLLYYYPLAAESIDEVEVTYPVLEQFVSVTVTNYTEFRDLMFRHGDWSMPAAGYLGYQSAGSIESLPGIVYDRTQGGKVTDCALKHCGGYGLHLGGTYATVSGCTLSDLGAGGIRNATLAGFGNRDDGVVHHNTITSNTIHDFGVSYFEGTGIFSQCNGVNTITSNTVYDGNYSGITVGWKWNDEDSNCHHNTVEDNIVYDVMRVLNDGAGIYLLGKQPGTLIQRNTFHDIKFVSGQQYYLRGIRAVYFDEGASQITVKKNLIYDCAAAMQMYAADANGNLFESNLIVNCINRVFEYRVHHVKTSIIRYNVVYNATCPTSALLYRAEHMGFISDGVRTYYTAIDGCFSEHDYNLYYYEDEGDITEEQWTHNAKVYEAPWVFRYPELSLNWPGAFADYTWQAGDMLDCTSTRWDRGSYEIESKTNDDQIIMVPHADLNNNSSSVGFHLPGETNPWHPWNLAAWQAAGYDEHCLEVDPLLVDYAGGDYRVRSDSPAIAMGFDAAWLIEAATTGKKERQLYIPGGADQLVFVPGSDEQTIAAPGKADEAVFLSGVTEESVSMPGSVESVVFDA